MNNRDFDMIAAGCWIGGAMLLAMGNGPRKIRVTIMLIIAAIILALKWNP